ncbi:unnamed protein product [Mytilus edulis]|uniref:Uncharacterized protein n=1 Tax=Mytilus edulis TaxID=6550 RepID=A0A8S3QH09_MYTED|nr:unnamed protein product [Mytilus edulis]
MVLGIVGAHETASESSKKSVAERSQNKFIKLISSSDSILPIPTFDQIKTEEFYTKIDEMNKLLRGHKNTYKELQQQQKTAEMSRNYLADKLSSKNLKARDNSIKQLQTTLTDKKQKAAESAKRYLTLLTKEKMTRNAMRMEFHAANGFKVRLPDIQYANYKSGIHIMKEQPPELPNVQRNNNSCYRRVKLPLDGLRQTLGIKRNGDSFANLRKTWSKHKTLRRCAS